MPDLATNPPDDIRYTLGRLDSKVDILLSTQVARDAVLKDVSDRLRLVETDIAALKVEKTTREKTSSTAWAILLAILSLGVSAFQAVSAKLLN